MPPSPSRSRHPKQTPADAPPSNVYLVKGEDRDLVAQEARSLIRRLVGDLDPTLVVEELGGPNADGLDVGTIVDASTTPPFLVDKRVVVVRDAGRLTAEDGRRLAPVLGEIEAATALVLVAGGGSLPPGLARTVAARGTVVDVTTGTSRERSRWFSEQVGHAPVHLDGRATSRLSDHLGQDMARLGGLLDTLAAAYGEGAMISEEELNPYLGEAGDVAPWDLTDAVDGGEPEKALAALSRMTKGGGRSAPEILGVLHRHFENMLFLDGSPARTADEAAEVLGARSSFVARKALTQAERLGSERLASAIVLLGQADLDIKGHSALSPGLVLEVLVARLARLARRGSATGRHTRRSNR